MHCHFWFNPWFFLIILSLLQQAETTKDTRKSTEFSKEAKKFSIISILTWVAILALTPMLMALISYLLTLSDWSKPQQKTTRGLWHKMLMETDSRQFIKKKLLTTMKENIKTWRNWKLHEKKRLPSPCLCW